MSRQTVNLTPQLHDYLLSVSVREPEILRRLREETAGLEQAVMQISPEQGQFMGLLVELLGAKNIIEIGTFTGYSALCMAMALPEDGRIVCCDISEQWTEIARRYWLDAGVEQNIRLHLAPAKSTLHHLIANGQSGCFDMAFIDADKTAYKDYYESCLQLLKSGGLIMIDNTLWNGAVADPSNQDADTAAIREFNEHLYNDDRVGISLLPIGDGLTLAVKK